MDVLKALAGMRNPVMDKFMLGVSYVGMPYVLIALVVWYYLNVDKDEAYGMGMSFCFSCLLCQAVKVVCRIPRPWNLDTTFKPVEAAVSSATGYSFPSIHTQSATSVFGSIIYFEKRRVLRIISAVMLFLVAFSRLYLGVHTLKDVLVGFLAAAVVSCIIWYFWNKIRREKRFPDILAFFLLTFGVILIAMTTALLMNGTIDYNNASDSLKTAGSAIGFAAVMYVESHFIHLSVSGTLVQKILRFALCVGGGFLLSTLIKLIPGSDSIPLLVLRYAVMLVGMMMLGPVICIRIGILERVEPLLRTPEI